MKVHQITGARTLSFALAAIGLLAVMLLAATASTASARTKLYYFCGELPTILPPTGQVPNWSCLDAVRGPGKKAFNFGARRVGTTSPAQGFALGVTVNNTFDPSISVSGAYAQTNNCPPTLSTTVGSPGFCLIRVTFDPTSTGRKKGTLRTGPGGPTARLKGRGVKRRTPPVLPLRLDANLPSCRPGAEVCPPQKLKSVVRGISVHPIIGDCVISRLCPHHDVKLVLRGDVKKTTKRLETSVRTKLSARLKHLKQLKQEPTAPEVKIKLKATDEFGQTATEVRKVTLCSRLVPVPNEHHIRACMWHGEVEEGV
jgi:hypothetical protein